ncbi:MAG: asparagine synthetase B [bacterium]
MKTANPLILALRACFVLAALLQPQARANADVWRARNPKILIFMDEAQNDHLRAYGVAYWCLQPPRAYRVQWLLNYRGGSFLADDSRDVRDYAARMGVSFEILSTDEANSVYRAIENVNAEVVLLEKAPGVAVYVPEHAEPWDDAVRITLDYAKIPYDTLWDREVLAGQLEKYDWIHLHHEDFSGQFGKFYANFRTADWYVRTVEVSRRVAAELGFDSVRKEKRAVALAIKRYVSGGGFLFGMCSVPDSLDVALAADGVDVVPPEIDGTPLTPGADDLLDFSQTFAFHNFSLVADAREYEISDIDVTPPNLNNPALVPDFALFEFSAKQDPVLSIFVQNHKNAVADFLGQTTAFRRDLIRDDVVILADTPGTNRVKYVHGNVGGGSFTFLGGHDPEDFAHYVGEKPTRIELHKNSPGYRLILNNVLFPAVKKKEKKT